MVCVAHYRFYSVAIKTIRFTFLAIIYKLHVLSILHIIERMTTCLAIDDTQTAQQERQSLIIVANAWL